MKTIAYVLSAFPVLSETFIGNEIRAMEAQGHRVVPMVFDLRDGPFQPADAGLKARMIQVRTVSTASALAMVPFALRALGFARQQKLLSQRSLLWHAMKIAAVARCNGASHIHAHFAGGAAAHAIAAGAMAALPVTFTCHGHDIYAEPEDLDAKFAHAHAVVCVCDDMRDDVLANGHARNVVRIACGTDPDRFRPQPDGTTDNGRLLFVGRLVEQKGIDDLLGAIARLSGTHRIGLDIVGSGPLQDRIKQQADELNRVHGHNIRLLGAWNADDLRQRGPGYLGVCLPFKTAPDGSRDTGPLVVKEAMAMGLPVISTAYMGVKETVTPQTGLLVPPADPDALAGAIETLLTLPAGTRRAMGLAGRERVRNLFTLNRQASALSALVEAA